MIDNIKSRIWKIIFWTLVIVLLLMVGVVSQIANQTPA